MDYTQYVTDLYRTQLGRDPDPIGLQGWVNALTSGQATPEQVRQGFTQSSEYGSVATNQYSDLLNKLYQEEVGRAPDPMGLAGWSAQLKSGQITPDQLRGQIANSSEGWLYDQYHDLLGRGFDPAAMQWTAALENGTMTRDQVLAAIKGSQEYTAHTEAANPLKDEYGEVGVPGQGGGSGRFSGVVTPFTNYGKMRDFTDPRSQTFGFLYDTIENRLGNDKSVNPTSLLNSPSLYEYNKRPTQQQAGVTVPGVTVSPYTIPAAQTTTGSGSGWSGRAGGGSTTSTPNLVGGLLDAQSLITSLYQSELNRAPDPVGLSGWTDAINGGMTRDQLLWNIQNSPEYMAIHNPAPADTFSWGDTGGGGGSGI